MATLRTNKLDAARRQTDAAIRLHFRSEDPFAIHTIASAAHRILRDIAEKKGNCEWHEGIKRLIRPDMVKKFWSAGNTASNFLKHAENDPQEILEVEEEVNDFTILGCCMYYTSLGFTATDEMRGFMNWHIVMYPHLLLDESPWKAMLASSKYDWLRNLPRHESLKHGEKLIALIKNNG